MSMPTLPYRGTTLAATLAGSALLATIAAPGASAHNVLIDSSPEDGATVDTMPDEVELVFNEEVLEGGNAITVVGPDGNTDYAEGENVRLDGTSAAVDIAPLEEAGAYTVDYRIVSADGHPIEESISFTLAAEALDDTDAAEEAQEEADTGGEETQATNEEDEDTDGETAADTNPLAGNTWLGAAAALLAIGVIVILVVRAVRHTGSGNSEDS
ncbi:copper resistance protein CopC [Lipingzhangella sp. LS1_29]|uniref:Copper resistance protein CopC n=1 Tax=Lipingzhangella rawalii TaxID=2055835 RepID=A0ABU2H3M0_9ACTN|nr:copper resistance protein CopC [Lipingzhangella rawalii]MDS1269901.1 copper resistance protein CopC [Lipingzhangella rawalii]